MATTTQSNGSSKTEAKSVKDLEAELAVLRSDISDISETLKGIGKSGASDLNARARDTASNLKAKGAAQARQAGEQANAAYGAAEHTVRQNPAASVGVAAGVGFLVGLFMSRRS